jgi:hypothetical protein
MRKAAKPQVVGHKHTIDYPDKVSVVINGREVPSAPQYWAFAKLDPPRIIINVTEERRRLSLRQAIAWLRDKLQRLARRLGIARVSPEPCHSHKIKACEEATPVRAVRAPAKRKSRRKRRQGLKSHKRAVRRS